MVLVGDENEDALINENNMGVDTRGTGAKNFCAEPGTTLAVVQTVN